MQRVDPPKGSPLLSLLYPLWFTGKLIREGKRFGLSLGDRACISLALICQLPVLTSDKIWNQADLDVEVMLLR